jgi:hypothetical protein
MFGFVVGDMISKKIKRLCVWPSNLSGGGSTSNGVELSDEAICLVIGFGGDFEHDVRVLHESGVYVTSKHMIEKI